MIKPIPILVMLCDLSEWCFLKIVQPLLLSSSHCRLKESHVLHKSVSNGFILINIHELLTLILLLISKRLLSEIPPTRKNPLASPVEPASRTSPVEHARRLRFIDGFKFICSAHSMGNVFTVQIWIIYIDIVACKMCVITSVRSWMGSMFQNLDPWLPNIFPSIAKKKSKVYATKRYHYLLMTRLACDQLGAYFLGHNHVPVFYHQSRFTNERCDIFLNLGLSNPLEAVKKLQYSVRCAIAVKHNYSNIQIVLPLTWTPVLIAKNVAHYLKYMCVCVCACGCVCVCYEPRTRMLRHTPLESSRHQSRIATVYSWHWNWQTLF